MSAKQLKNHNGPMARSLHEALSLVFAPNRVEMILNLALMISQRGIVPEEAQRARDFVYGPLLKAIAEHGHEGDADVVLERLEPILAMAESHVRLRDDESGVQLSAPPPAMAAPRERVVLMSSLDRTSVQALARQLVNRAKVRQVASVFDLISAIEAHYSDEVQVVLWGATQRQRVALEHEMPVARHWVPCPSTANHDELAMLIEHLLDRYDALIG
jgi:hypothetical protein